VSTAGQPNFAAVHDGVAVKPRPWRVIHACDSIRAVAELVEAQVAAGMRPFVLTAEVPSTSGSLLDAWAHVRAWKRYLEESDSTTHPLQTSIVHAHSFAAAMAGVRAGLATVYDLSAFVEDYAVTNKQCTERSWLARSFRAAEEFVLPRAGAVVVHAEVMRRACQQRGVGDEEVFVVPAPMQIPHDADEGWLRRAFDFPEEVVTIFARPSVADDETLIRAFAQVAEESEHVRLFLAGSSDQVPTLRRFAHQHDVEDKTFFLAAGDEGPALRAADIVIAGWPIYPDESPWGRIAASSTAVCGVAITAMAYGRCLLAADCSGHRDLSPEGGGCLWYGSGSEGSSTKDKAVELAHRISFLARNRDLRKTLGAAARRHIALTRAPERIGRMYQEIYHHAEMRGRRGDDQSQSTPLLIPSELSA